MSNLTKTQAKALERINREGTVYPYNGISTATIRVLVRLNLIDLEEKPPTRQYGTLGVGEGHRGRWVRNWIARAKRDQ